MKSVEKFIYEPFTDASGCEQIILASKDICMIISITMMNLMRSARQRKYLKMHLYALKT